MLLAKLVNWGETMEGLHDIQHVSRAHHCRLAVVVGIQVLVCDLLILQTQKHYRFLNVLEKDIILPFHGLASPWNSQSAILSWIAAANS
jgi:hypothetical protein